MLLRLYPRLGEHDPEVRRRFVALAEAAEHAATQQVRNAATLGGNLLQRPRCWYFRYDHFHQAGGDDVERVRAGQNQYHALFDKQRTVMVHASTPATALTAYGASVELTGPGGKTRMVTLSNFLLPPDMKRPTDTIIAPNELLTRVHIPAPAAGTKAAYHKQGERESYDWPICDVVVVLQMDGRVVRQTAIALGWVASSSPPVSASMRPRPRSDEACRASSAGCAEVLRSRSHVRGRICCSGPCCSRRSSRA